MLKEIERVHVRSAPPQNDEVLLIPPRFNSIFRHKWLILRVCAAFACLAILFAAFRHDSYTAVAKLLIDNKSLQLSRLDAVFARSEVDVPLIQNQIELLRSATIANQVIDGLQLAEDRNFVGRSHWFPEWLRRPEDADDRRRAALDAFNRSLYVGRVGDSYVLEIRFTAPTADQAANVANKIGSDYINLLIETNAKLAQSASPWLRTRLKDMGPNASVITAATPPIRRDGPSSLLVLCAALLVGAGFGITGAFAVDVRDRTVRTPYQAATVAGAECLGIAPRLKGRNLLFEASRHPKSHLAHAMRRAIAAIREQPELKTVGVVSILPREGKTVIAASLAQVAANSGCRVILVDAAPYNRTLTGQLAPDAKAGLHDVLKKRLSVADVLWDVSDTNLTFLPLGEDGQNSADRSNGLAGFCGVQDILPDAAAAADLVVVDLPPATLVADLREIASAVDGFLLVVEWGNTSVDVISSALACNYEMQRKLIGVILNKVDIPKLRTYDDSLAVLYDQTRYSLYLNDEGGAARRTHWFKRARRTRAGAVQQKRVKQQ